MDDDEIFSGVRQRGSGTAVLCSNSVHIGHQAIQAITSSSMFNSTVLLEESSSFSWSLSQTALWRSRYESMFEYP